MNIVYSESHCKNNLVSQWVAISPTVWMIDEDHLEPFTNEEKHWILEDCFSGGYQYRTERLLELYERHGLCFTVYHN